MIGEGVAEGVIPFILYHILYYMYICRFFVTQFNCTRMVAPGEVLGGHAGSSPYPGYGDPPPASNRTPILCF